MRKTRRMSIERAFKIARPSVNLLIRELLPDHDGSIKIEVVVVDDCPTWDIALLSIGYQAFKVYAPERFSKFLQGGTLIGYEWLTPHQARRLRNLQDSSFFVPGIPSFSRQLWGGGINRDSAAVLMSVGSRVRKFRGRHRSW